MLTQILNQSLQSTDSGNFPGAWVELTDRNLVGFQLATTGSLVGTWLIESSSLPLPLMPDASPSNITAGFSTPAGTAIAAVAGAPSSQGVQATVPIQQGRIRATFVKTGGSGVASVNVRN